MQSEVNGVRPNSAASPEVIYHIPIFHWFGDAVRAIAISFIVMVVLFIFVSCVVVGAYNGSLNHFYWIIPTTTVLGLLAFRSASRGRIGRSWRLTTSEMQRGRSFLTTRVNFDDVQIIAYERSGKNEVYLRIRTSYASITVFLGPREMQEIFEVMRRVCPHAAAIDLNGKSLMPLDSNLVADPRFALVKEWKCRGRRYLIGLFIILSVSTLFVVALFAAAPSVASALHLVHVAWFIGLGLFGLGVASLRAFREADRIARIGEADVDRT